MHITFSIVFILFCWPSVIKQSYYYFRQKIPPEPEPNLPSLETLKAIELWKNAIHTDNTISLDMNNITSCIESKARFTQSKFEVDSHVTIEVFIRSTCPEELTFTHLKVMVNSPNYSSEFAVVEGGQTNMCFKSGEVKRFLVEFVPDVQDVGQDVQIGKFVNLTK